MRGVTVKIRTYQEEDQSAVIALWHACGLVRPWNDPAKDIERKVSMQPELFFVGEREGRVIATAMAGYDGHRGSVYYLTVDPACQHQGLGRLLMATIEQRLHAMGCPKLNILVRTTNETVLAFYRKLGYSVDEAVSLGKRLMPDD
ncbi:GNAT family acetyltransferase [Billgrantia antri]|uniref:GNAT family acetyltransferase n=1 Tax=Halomonas sulfidivorans TaxID=2733488 RepID=A0ABX7WEL9_9GAMM|nr:GNAT family acetyltransferase [Halomonas sulfidivorans]QTP58839.1 GNAT family acetyltransferase [Halomonas sulfidivorans]